MHFLALPEQASVGPTWMRLHLDLGSGGGYSCTVCAIHAGPLALCLLFTGCHLCWRCLLLRTAAVCRPCACRAAMPALCLWLGFCAGAIARQRLAAGQEEFLELLRVSVCPDELIWARGSA